MATSLQQQLAAINAKSTDQLNLKAQKTRHSQSILFEPREAAAQSFETIFHLCQEGFAELCQLDRRYIPFSRNLFAEDSLTVEREQLNTTENKDLNVVITQFLGLVSGKLLLRPAQKCLEWLVRRWRVHEHNTSTLLYAVLPYHSHELFATILSILPKQLPVNFTFLRPYVASLQCPPRHTLVSTAVSNDSFIAGFSTFVLETSKRRLQSSVLIGTWVSIVAQSLNIRLDGAQSGRDDVRRQRSEDVLLKMLPVLQDMLAISGAPDLYLAACMLMTILATKVDLEDKVLDAFMESVVAGWSRETVRDGTECLAVLAEEKHETAITRKVFKAILEQEEALVALPVIGSKIRVDSLMLSMIDWCIRSAKSHADADADVMKSISLLLGQLADASRTPKDIQERISQIRTIPELASNAELRPLLEHFNSSTHTAAQLEDVEMIDAGTALSLDDQTGDSDDAILDTIKTLPSTDTIRSFLSPTPEVDDLFATYMNCFTRCCAKVNLRQAFLESRDLHANDNHNTARTLTFLARSWTSAKLYRVRLLALEDADKLVQKISLSGPMDFQSLCPYIITALADSSAPVRKAAANLLTTLLSKNADAGNVSSATKTTLYGKETKSIQWLTTAGVAQSFAKALEIRLQECVLDASIVRLTVLAHLNDSKGKVQHRSQVSSFLVSHALATPVATVQSVLLNLISDVGKAASEAKINLIVPYIRTHAAEKSPRLDAAIQCLSHRSEIEIHALQDVSKTVGSAAYQKLTQIFSHAKPEFQIPMVDWLFARALPEHEAASDGDAAHTLRTIRLPIEIMIHVLTTASSKGSTVERPVKRQRLGRPSIDSNTISSTSLDFSLRRASMCLEIVEDALSENRPTTDDVHYVQLVKLLFSMLGDIQVWRAATGSELTYLQVLTLNNILTTLKYSNATAIDQSVLRTDMVVETLRSNASPQVHNSALLVISKIATFAPDAVLHSVMPLFTFMSSSTLRQADAYSVHVINMTIESIVPPLRESLKANGKELVAGASDLLLSFTAAFEHVPGHRRQDTFVQLLRVLGPDESLYAVLAMLVERYNEDITLIETLRSIMRVFSVQLQLNALVKYLDLIADASKKRRFLSNTILGFSEKNAAEANASVATLLDGWANLILSSGLQSKVANELRKDGAQAIEQTYSTLLGKLVGLPYDTTNAVKFDEPTLKSAHDAALRALLTLLPTEEFIASSATLMQAGSEQVRVKVFTSLTDRVNSARLGDARLAEIFIDCLPNCSVFLSISQPVSVRKAAIDCVDAISEKYGKRDRTAVSNVIKAIMGPAALSSEVSLLQTASLLCLASSVEVLGEEFVSTAKPMLETALDLAAATTTMKTVDLRLVEAVFTLINAVLDHEAWLLDSASLGRAIVLASKSQQLGLNSLAIDQFCALAPKTLPLKELCSSLSATFHGITELGSEAILARARIFHAAITASTKAIVTKSADPLGSLLLRLFSLRPAIIDADDASSAAYNLTLTSALDMTLKLNDLTFRPLFIKVVSWAHGDGHDKARRQIALFELAKRLFDQLGSIVTAYASYLLDDIAAILTEDNTDEEWEGLAIAVMQALSANFKSDQDDFWTTPQHFDAVMHPLLDLLSQPSALKINLGSTLEEFAAAVSASPDRLKTLNARMMIALRHEDAAIRLNAVKCERQITARLTFDWLNLLPEMLPYISELLEDDDEAVERAVLSWVKEIEEVTGESLEGMLA